VEVAGSCISKAFELYAWSGCEPGLTEPHPHSNLYKVRGTLTGMLEEEYGVGAETMRALVVGKYGVDVSMPRVNSGLFFLVVRIIGTRIESRSNFIV
jgi:hypothetical protein